MGNQLTGVAPSQILPVEHYLTDVSDYEFDHSLGSTRFFKVARAKFKEGLAVVKVFVIHDPSLPLRSYKDQLEAIKTRLAKGSNCLPFLRSTLSDKAALLFRQYVRNNLYDRISTRPFLIPIEKKWIAFQLLCALNQAHLVGVCHGDIKSENVMVTGWLWVLLTDFASFKPTYLPADNPADFSFFFDTSRRRTCYIAPERFVEGSSSRQVDNSTSEMVEGLQVRQDVKGGELTPAMDIFSAGCVIAELFTEGNAPFDLSQLLAYRSGAYSPDAILDQIGDEHIKELVKQMLQKDPAKRLSAEQYLVQWRGTAFPEYFYTFLKVYMGEFAGIPIYPADEKIARLRKDMGSIMQTLVANMENGENGHRHSNNGLVIVLSLVTACLRSLKFCVSRLAALDIMLMIAKHLPDDIILDRITPCILHFVRDPFPRVRAEAIRTLTQTLTMVKSVPRGDANIFPDYILPNLSNMAQDSIDLVRVSYAENIAVLAETALRFLEMVQLDQSTSQSEETVGVQNPAQYQASYDDELQNLHEMIQQKVVTLLTDPENIVKQTLLENGITRLCIFFGRQKANDILLSHMITFLNDKEDWHQRGAFFDSIVGVAAYVGWQSSLILKPLLQQGLTDSEEHVICKALKCVTGLVELGLLQKPALLEMANELVPYVCHPDLWIRQATVGFIAAIARSLDIADVHCNLTPLLTPFLKKPIIQIDKEAIVMSVLKSPVPRSVYDYILRSPIIIDFFDNLTDRQLIRNLCRPGHKPEYNELEMGQMAQLLRKLQNQGMMEEDEDKLLYLRDLMLKLSKAKSGMVDLQPPSPSPHNPFNPGQVNLSVHHTTQMNHADLIKPPDLRSEVADKAQTKKTKKKQSHADPAMNEEWRSMFGTTADPKPPKASQQTSVNTQPLPHQPGSEMPLPHAPVQRTPSQPQLQTKVPAQGQTPPPAQVQQTQLSRQQSAPPGQQVQDPSSPDSKSKTVAPRQAPPQQPASSPVSVKQGSPTKGEVTERGAKGLSANEPISMSQLQAAAEGVPLKKPVQETKQPVSHLQVSPCLLNLRNLVTRKRDQYATNIMRKMLIHDTTFNAKAPQSSWKPRGLLVAHLHEHKGAVNRLQVSHDHALFTTCSDDGTVKVWDCTKLLGKANTNKSRQTYNRQAGKIKTLTFCQSKHSIASGSDDGSIHVNRIDSSPHRFMPLDKRELDIAKEGVPVDLAHFDTGPQSVLVYATSQGYLVGWDLRSPNEAFRLCNEQRHGLITSFVVDPQQCWMAVGTTNGSHVCWDMRFQLPITTVQHPSGALVRRVRLHPSQQSWVISAVQGNNEVSMWDMETGARQFTLWASPHPPLSQTQTSQQAIHALYCIPSIEFQPCFLTAGSDQRIRYWNPSNPQQSGIIAGSINDPVTQPVISYNHRVIDGTEVIVETYGKQRGAAVAPASPSSSSSSDENQRRSAEQVPVGHKDVITDMGVFQISPTSNALVTCSRDGVVKIWK
ncbi:phosphoinositide 3-kinase regulatory subunit 4-like [Diadema setosum]|uniref:phosphoinositide 3-kinase regulatory subunit 4-like n=1 Tax=Diadema setosum TaxID=31175 RepID=UPI003B3B200C